MPQAQLTIQILRILCCLPPFVSATLSLVHCSVLKLSSPIVKANFQRQVNKVLGPHSLMGV